eukprot:TRINITY_DN5719_c0_g2_i2.p1 TRINITY_DN5719_c0_g2~~TRINITY_DN5719_c0_g2_i2.p1  ORF type:complete len:504 (+),score=91.50 TRINITY_DN5719_c0_g2_i2:459-1970(+)
MSFPPYFPGGSNPVDDISHSYPGSSHRVRILARDDHAPPPPQVSWAVPGLLPDISKDACQAFLSRTDSSLCRPDRVGRLTPQGVADAVAGFARGQHVQAALPAVHREHVLRGGGGYKAWVQERGVSFTVAAKWVWACTALRAECAELMGAVADRVRAAHPRDLTPRVLATFMWAFVKAHHAEVRTVLDCVGAAVGAGRSPAAFGKAHAARVLWSVGEYVGRGGTWDGAPRAVPALVNVVLGVGEAQATRGGDDEGEAFFEADDMGLLTATLWACASCRIAGETVELIAQRVRHPHGRGGQGGGAITDERLPLALWSFHRLRRWDMCDVLSRQLLQRGQEGARVTPAAAYPILRMLHQTEYHHPELLDAVLAAFLPVGNGPSGFAGVDGVKRAMGVARAGLQFAPLDPRAVRHALLHLTRLGTCQQLPARDLLDVLRAAAAYPDALPEATARRLAAHAGSVEVLTTARKDEAALLRDAAARLRAGGRAAAGPPGRQRNSFADIT